MALPFLDTNIFLRHLTHDHPDHSPRATAYLASIERGEIQARTTDLVIFETVYTLQRFYKQPKDKIRDTLLPLINLPGIPLPPGFLGHWFGGMMPRQGGVHEPLSLAASDAHRAWTLVLAPEDRSHAAHPTG